MLQLFIQRTNIHDKNTTKRNTGDYKMTENKILKNGGYLTPEHDKMLITYFKDSPKLITLLAYVSKLEVGDIEIISWQPEKIILNERGDVVGAIDLYVEFKSRKKGYILDCALEFKPEMDSFSGVLRQIHTHLNYLKVNHYIVVTKSLLLDYEKIFLNEGVLLWRDIS